ncbi:hypothetical protein F383_27479 [Gossypium arboreum]|uniref:Uncharacterized protein n=1 Tax=Gossypium arboreum TaxID=29729 RepID=A0A0B0P7R8_GOSAR|nr:hypothetical protein F383_27923 [Gossypium arboreum]KHG21245.1 hypothetical protein F383_27479 [Gossypium arboreum]
MFKISFMSCCILLDKCVCISCEGDKWLGK